jgi:ACR3 family arsenite efflux pump ArsB
MTKAGGFSIAWILPAIALGGALGFYAPVQSDALVAIQWGALALMVFLVVSSLPLLSVGKALAKPRVLVPLFALNLVVVPLIAFVLSRMLWQAPELQVGLLLVLLAPGVALSLSTAAQAGGDVESVLATKPLLLVGQLIVVPLYAVVLSTGAFRLEDVPPTFVVIAAVIIAPSLLALLWQGLGQKFPGAASARISLTRFTVPVISVTIALVLWNRVPGQLEQVEELYRLVPLFFAFLVLLAPIGLLAGILASLSQAEKRAMMIVGAGRGGIIMLPIALALEVDVWGLVPLVVIVQLGIEVLGLLVYRSIVPEIVPSWGR